MAANQISLYHGSLDIPQALVLLKAWFLSPFISRSKAEADLAEALRADLERGYIFAFASARGAISAVFRAAGISQGDEVILSDFTQ